MHLFQMKVVEIDKIDIVERARKEFGDIEGLASGMAEVGIIQPIAVRDLNTGRYQLLAGERRLRSLILQGEKTVPACVFGVEITPRQQKLVELLENVKRKDFTPAEEAELTQNIHSLMVSEHGDPRARGAAGQGWKQKDTATLLGCSIAKVSQDLEIAQTVKIIPSLKDVKTRGQLVKKINNIVKTAVRQKAAAAQLEKLDGEVKTRKQILLDNFIVADFFAGVKHVPDRSVEFIECDPPYGVNLTEVKGDIATTYEDVPAHEYVGFITRVAEELWRVSAKNAWLLFWHDPSWESMVKTRLEAAGWDVRRTKLLWIKDQAKNSAPASNLSQYYEQAYVCAKGSPKLMHEARSALFEFPCVPTQFKVHATERPIQLLEEIIEVFTPADVSVFVPFLGSGKTLMAAANKGRSGFGFDKSEKHKAAFTMLVGGQIHGLYTDDTE